MVCKTPSLIFLAACVCSSEAFRTQMTIKKLVSDSGRGPDNLPDNPEGFHPICGKEIIKETCSLFHGSIMKNQTSGMQWVPLDSIKGFLSAHEEDVKELWKELGFPALPSSEVLKHASEDVKNNLLQHGLKILQDGDESFLGIACEKICHAVRDYIQEKHVLPPSSDMACQKTAGNIVCDIDARPEVLLQELWRSGDLPPLYKEDSSTIRRGPHGQGQHGHGQNKSTLKQQASLDRIDYAIWELVEGVANLFRFYPLLEPNPKKSEDTPSLLELGDNANSTSTWADKAKMIGKKAITYVNLVKRDVNLDSSKGHIKEWFGKHDKKTKDEIFKVLNSVEHVLKNVHYHYPGPTCGEKTFAYVYPEGDTCNAAQVANKKHVQYCRMHDDKFVVYLCDTYMNADEGAQIETLYHEGSHHATAYTEDECVDKDFDPDGDEDCENEAYGRSACITLATTIPERALTNADNHCYFLQAIADPQYHAQQRCKPESHAINPFADSDGDCHCPEDGPCHDGNHKGCPSAAGRHRKYFKSTCANCHCKVTAKKCLAKDVAFADSDEGGDCKCKSGTVCNDGGKQCEASFGPSDEYFKSTCKTCECISADSAPPPTPTATPSPCPRFATQKFADSEGNCMCRSPKYCFQDKSFKCLKADRTMHIRKFDSKCTTCKCEKKTLAEIQNEDDDDDDDLRAHDGSGAWSLPLLGILSSVLSSIRIWL